MIEDKEKEIIFDRFSKSLVQIQKYGLDHTECISILKSSFLKNFPRLSRNPILLKDLTLIFRFPFMYMYRSTLDVISKAKGNDSNNDFTLRTGVGPSSAVMIRRHDEAISDQIQLAQKAPSFILFDKDYEFLEMIFRGSLGPKRLFLEGSK